MMLISAGKRLCESLYEPLELVEVKTVSFRQYKSSFSFPYVYKMRENLKPADCHGCIPQVLVPWLKDTKGMLLRNLAHIKVVFGEQDDSFIAWDLTSVIWTNIPQGLEKGIESWLHPAGWLFGPPRVIALGCGGSYFVLSLFGAYSYYISPELRETNKVFQSLNSTEGFVWSNIEVRPRNFILNSLCLQSREKLSPWT